MSDQQADHNSDEDETQLEVFLDRDGSIGILVNLDTEEGHINKDLQNLVHVVSTTLSRRLTEARQLGLIEVSKNPEDHGNAKRYQLTDRGDALRRRLLSRDVGELYDEFVELHDQLKTEEKALGTWALEKGIDDPRWPGEPSRDDDRPDT